MERNAKATGLIGSVLTLCLLGPQTASGQSVLDTQGNDYLSNLATLSDIALTSSAPLSFPRFGKVASTVGVPSGFVLSPGSAFVAGAISNNRERTNTKGLDGSAALGVGFGNSQSSLGFDVTLGVSSVEPKDFGDSGSLNFKIGQEVTSPFTNGVAGLSMGVTRAVAWGDMKKEPAGIYFVASSTLDFTLGNTIIPGMISVGYGTNIGTRENTNGVIFGVGVGVTRGLSLGASWYGNEVVAGATLSAQMSRSLSTQIGVIYGDLLHRNSSGRWALSVSLISIDPF